MSHKPDKKSRKARQNKLLDQEFSRLINIGVFQLIKPADKKLSDIIPTLTKKNKVK